MQDNPPKITVLTFVKCLFSRGLRYRSTIIETLLRHSRFISRTLRGSIISMVKLVLYFFYIYGVKFSIYFYRDLILFHQSKRRWINTGGKLFLYFFNYSWISKAIHFLDYDKLK